MARSKLRLMAALVPLAGSFAPLLSGCGDLPGSGDVPDKTAEKQQAELYVLTSVLWPAAHNGSTRLSVCFEESGFATERQWVQDAIAASWGTPSRFGPDAASYPAVVFSGWGTCGAGGANLRIHFQDAGGSSAGLGTQVNNRVSAIKLNTWASGLCVPGWNREKCVKSTAAHEFGHGLGFAHEQNRDDKPSSCTQPAQGTNGNVKIGSFDWDSVMNYCNPVRNNGGLLSTTDVVGFQKYYGPFFDADGDPSLKTYNTDITNQDGAPVRSGSFLQCRGANELLVGMDQRDGTNTIQCRQMLGGWEGDIAGRRIGYSNSGIVNNGALSCPWGFAAFGVDFSAGLIKCGSVNSYNGSTHASGGSDYNHFFFNGVVHEIHYCPTGVIQGANVNWPTRPDLVGFNFSCVDPG